jgi:hypothetical protein
LVSDQNTKISARAGKHHVPEPEKVQQMREAWKYQNSKQACESRAKIKSDDIH